MPKTRDARVRIYPIEGRYLPGVRAVERLVPSEYAGPLTESAFPAFTRTRPEGQDSPSDDVDEQTDDLERELGDLVEQPVPVQTPQPAVVQTTTPTGEIVAPVAPEDTRDA